MAKFRRRLLGGTDPVIGPVPVTEVRRFFGWHYIGSPLNALNKKRNKALKQWQELKQLMADIQNTEKEIAREAEDLRHRGHAASEPWVDPKQLSWFVRTEPDEIHPGMSWKDFEDRWRRTFPHRGGGNTTRYSSDAEVAREAGRRVEFDGHTLSGMPGEYPTHVMQVRDPAKRGHQGQQQQQGKRKGGGNNQGGGQNQPTKDPWDLPELPDS